MDDLQSEKEQIEEIRAWWAEYGRYVIAGVVIAVALMVGFNQYKSNKLAAELEASALFESLAGHVFEGDVDDAELVADELANNYANTSYAAQSKLAMARLYMDKSRDQDAADVLQELLAMRGNGALRHVGRLRLARVLLYQDKPQEVIDLLVGQDNKAFEGLYAEALGDAFAALGQVEAAGESYRIALADTSQTVNRGLVQMKLIDLPDAQPVLPEVSGPEPEASAPGPDAVTEPDAEPVSDDEAGESE
ncbi:MAG: tetratricopeptide repeat protein [Gammaproteobacteria bacterium]|nr:tetratricopeptide repeat protein [Gammaproteobacteria bacterium]MDH3372485.1 tetratricopeptide repeat protein [Gammaproteobacteria bacterium]MDH3410029.1 tetratricopeptide repeat protein [Gammaproteobacteria bacterium]MDH3554022.1 tetratricopeptide repeat protein [Gammaproteobacteria bacterium]